MLSVIEQNPVKFSQPVLYGISVCFFHRNGISVINLLSIAKFIFISQPISYDDSFFIPYTVSESNSDPDC